MNPNRFQSTVELDLLRCHRLDLDNLALHRDTSGFINARCSTCGLPCDVARDLWGDSAGANGILREPYHDVSSFRGIPRPVDRATRPGAVSLKF